MRGEIIFTGTELLLGQILNTNAQYLQQILALLGIDIYYQVTVGDNLHRLAEAILQATGRADLIVIAGGLGPTEDDVSREALSFALNVPLLQDEQALQVVSRLFKEHGIQMPPNNLKQALVPEGGVVLDNPIGTAPGVILEDKGKSYVLLPGPPSEFKLMINQHLVPYLSKKLGSQASVIASRVLKLCGLGESMADERLGDLLHSANPTLAPTSRFGEVHLRITSKAANKEEASKMNAQMEARVRERVGEYIYGVDDETLPDAIARILSQRGLSIATGETTCTGGLLGYLLTKSGELFRLGYVLGDRELLFEGKPLDDKELAEELATRVREEARAALGLAVTGEFQTHLPRPRGKIWVAIDFSGECFVKDFNVWGLPEDMRERAVQTTFTFLWRTLRQLQ